MSIVQKVELTDEQWLCIKMLDHCFKSDHMKRKTLRGVMAHLRYWFKEKTIKEALDLSNRASRKEIVLAKKLR